MKLDIADSTPNRAITVNKAVGMSVPVILGALVVFLVLELLLSLRWGPVHDTAQLHYVAWLVDRHGLVPYRDFFETSLPQSILIHVAIGRFLGFSDIAFRIVDITYLLALSGLTIYLLKPLGKRVAIAAAAVFGIVYLGYGPIMSFQRDYLGILPIVAALVIARGQGRPALRAFGIGALFGLEASTKPHLALGLPVVLLFAFPMRMPGSGSRLAPQLTRMTQIIGLAAVGMAIVVSLPILWVWSLGGFPDLWLILTRYLPLYIQMNGMHKIVTGFDRVLYLFTSFQELGGHGTLLIPASLGVYIALFESRLGSCEKRLVSTLAALTLVYGVYPVFSGQFWSYHWMPFIYFATICGSLALVSPVETHSEARRWFGPVVFIFGLLLTLQPAPDFFHQITGQGPRPPKNGRVDEMAAFLQRELRPGDTVQPLDWVDGGTAQAMQMAGALPATRFLYDAQFYHHLSNHYIEGLRLEFMRDLEAAPPRFIIDIPNQSRPTGPDTSSEFTALSLFVENNYTPVQNGEGYIIYEYAR